VTVKVALENMIRELDKNYAGGLLAERKTYIGRAARTGSQTLFLQWHAFLKSNPVSREANVRSAPSESLTNTYY